MAKSGGVQKKSTKLPTDPKSDQELAQLGHGGKPSAFELDETTLEAMLPLPVLG